MPATLAALGVDTGHGPVDPAEKWAEGRIEPDLAATRGWPVLEDVLATTTYEPGMFRLVGERGTVDPSIYLDTELAGGILRRTLRADVLRHELDRGSTLTVNGADRLDRRVQDDREVLEYAVGHPAWCNGFVSHSAGSSFGRHRDGHDTVVVQGAGRKHWRVFEPGEDGAELFARVLEPGDVLRVPAGWDHEVTGTGELSLHWTFGFVVPTNASLLAAALSRSQRDELERLTSLSRADLLEAARVRTLGRRNGANLPALHGAFDLATTEVRWAARLPPVVEVTADGVKIGSLGRRLGVDARLAGPVRRLGAGDRHLAADLVDDQATEAVVTQFLRWAVDQRLVLVESAR